MRARTWILGGEAKGLIWLSRIGRGMSNTLGLGIRSTRTNTYILIPHSVAWEYDRGRRQEGRKRGKEAQYCATRHANSNSLEMPCLNRRRAGRLPTQPKPSRPAGQSPTRMGMPPSGLRLDTLEERRAGMKMNAMN